MSTGTATKRPKPEPQLADYLGKLGLPTGFLARGPRETEKVRDSLARLDEELKLRRRYALGLWMAFVGLAEDALGILGKTRVRKALTKYPPQTTTGTGSRVNTLSLHVAGHTLGIRTRVNNFSTVAWQDLRRTDYPSGGAHATGRWRDYTDEIEAVFNMSPAERRALAAGVWRRLLQLDEAPEPNPTDVTVRPFEAALVRLDMTKSNGAVLQGMVYGYFSADAPDVRLESGKVKAGSGRVGAIGDVDGRSGTTLVLTVEVKDLDLTDTNHEDQLGGFLRNRSRVPDATAIVVARSFSASAEASLRAAAVHPVSTAEMVKAVQLWDLRKQRLAMRGALYFLDRIERKTALVRRLQKFIEDEKLDIG